MSWAQQRHALSQLLLACTPCWAFHFLIGMAFWGRTKGLSRGLAWGGRSAEAQYDALRHRTSDRSNYFWSFSRNLWCLIKDFTGFGRGWYVCLLSVQAQARRLRHVHLRSGITSSTEKQLNRQKTSSAVTTNHSFVPKRSRQRDN
jgi:hypothetical protein